MFYYRLNFPASKQRRAGITLLETVIALTIFGIIGTAIGTFFVTGMRTAHGVIRQNLLSVYGRSPVEDLKNRIRMASKVAVDDDGDLLTITAADGTVTYYRFDVPEDDEPRRARLNFRIGENGAWETVLRDVSRITTGEPVFFPVNNSTKSEPVAVRMQFRLGDPVGPISAAGSGGRHRAVDIVTTICLRNYITL